MYGKTVLITGGTDGLGKEAAIKIAELGATVVVTGRDRSKGERVIDELQGMRGRSAADLFVADFASQDDIRRLSREVSEEYDRLDVLINNAGLATPERRLTDDGVETTFAVNYLAPFILTLHLLPQLRVAETARIINVSSETHETGEIDFDDLDHASGYTWLGAYKQSKLALVLFTYELARRLEGTGVTVNCLEPGPVPGTNLGRDYPWYVRLAFDLWSRLPRRFVRSPTSVAERYVYLASSPDVADVTRAYFRDDRRKRSAPHTYDAELQRRLWEESIDLTGIPSELIPASAIRT